MQLLNGSSKKVASITDLAYIAGFFDGEGCVNFGKVRGAIFIRVMIVNTNNEYMAECLTFFNKKGQHNLEDPVARALCPS